MLGLPVLLVDDQPQVRLLMRKVLTKQGFRVIEEKNGLSALSIIQSLGGAICLLISEYLMPGLDGAALASRVKGQFPKVPILLMSSDAYSCDCTSGDAFLGKPFVPSLLVDTVHRLLAGQGTRCA
jgi:CheY-like chemotaxis protein